MLSVDKLTVDLGSVCVLREVTLSIPAGAMIGVIGRNGAGKTTIMRSVMGLLQVRSGGITLDAVDLRKVPAKARARLGVGYMPEDRRLVPDFTVEENVRLPAWAIGDDGADGRLQWVYELMPEVHESRQRRANQLSGGQQKMVALARALLAGRKLLLLDEPFEGLAPALARRFAEVLARLRESGLAVLVADSDERHVGDLLTTAYHIERGEITK